MKREPVSAVRVLIQCQVANCDNQRISWLNACFEWISEQGLNDELAFSTLTVRVTGVPGIEPKSTSMLLLPAKSRRSFLLFLLITIKYFTDEMIHCKTGFVVIAIDYFAHDVLRCEVSSCKPCCGPTGISISLDVWPNEGAKEATNTSTSLISFYFLFYFFEQQELRFLHPFLEYFKRPLASLQVL